MASEGTYYVPEQSKLPIFASLGMGAMAYGLASWINGDSANIFLIGSAIMAIVLWCWFSTVITENMNGLNDAQLKRSYVWGMGWFIFSEVMFFAAFFGALYYIRALALPWLSGEGSHASTNAILWSGFAANGH
jgi:cytochrome c oxidase subunit 3